MMYETIIFKIFCQKHSTTYYVVDHATGCEYLHQTRRDFDGVCDEGTDYTIEWGDNIELNDEELDALEHVRPGVYTDA